MPGPTRSFPILIQSFTPVGQCSRPSFPSTCWGVPGTHADPLYTSLFSPICIPLANPDLQPMPVSSPQIRHPCASQQASLQHVPDPMVSGPFTLPLHPHLSKESCLCTGPKLRSVLQFSSSHRSCQVFLQSPSFHPPWGYSGP